MSLPVRILKKQFGTLETRSVLAILKLAKEDLSKTLKTDDLFVSFGNNKLTLLHVSALYGERDLCEEILNVAAFKRVKVLEETDSRGWTALMYATAFGHVSTAFLLMEKGANLGHVTLAHEHIAMWSYWMNQGDICKLILRETVSRKYRFHDWHKLALSYITYCFGSSKDMEEAWKGGARLHIDGKGKTAFDHALDTGRLDLYSCLKDLAG